MYNNCNVTAITRQDMCRFYRPSKYLPKSWRRFPLRPYRFYNSSGCPTVKQTDAFHEARPRTTRYWVSIKILTECKRPIMAEILKRKLTTAAYSGRVPRSNAQLRSPSQQHSPRQGKKNSPRWTRPRKLSVAQKMGFFLFTRVIFSFVTLLGYHMVFSIILWVPYLNFLRFFFSIVLDTIVRGA